MAENLLVGKIAKWNKEKKKKKKKTISGKVWPEAVFKMLQPFLPWGQCFDYLQRPFCRPDVTRTKGKTVYCNTFEVGPEHMFLLSIYH